MSEKYKFHNPTGIYFITPTLVGWADLFTRKVYRDVVVESLIYCQQVKGLKVYAWCIMPSHLHLIVGVDGQNSLSEIIRDFKKHTAKTFVKTIREINESRQEWLLALFEKEASFIRRNKKYKVWQDGSHPIELLDNRMIDDRLNYFHMNPVKEEMVREPEHYCYSSAIDYYRDEKGMIEIERIAL